MEFKKIQTIAFFALLIGVGILFYRIVQPYLFALFWAAVIASLFYPVYERIKKITKKENVSAGLTVLLTVLIVVLPLAGIFGLVVKQAVDTYNELNNPEKISSIQHSIRAVIEQPIVKKFIGDVPIEERIHQLVQFITANGLRWLKAGSQSTIGALISTLVMLYSLFYFLRDGKKWLKHVMHLLPFGDENEKILFQKFVSTARATLKGTILIGSIQGTIGGILLFIVGIPAAAFWGVVMIVFCIIPAVGASIVLYPAAIYLFVTGQTWQGIVIVSGALFVSIVDNLLRPPLVGRDIQMHTLMIFFATIGGLVLFGISGVVIGPIIAAFFSTLIEMYEIKYKKELDSART